MKLLDEEEVPFTREEIQTAATLWLGPKKGVTVAEEIVESLPGYVVSREARRAELVQGGHLAEVLRCDGYNISMELLACISNLSGDAATRVEALLVKRWSGLRDQYIRQAWARISRRGGHLPVPPATVFGEAEARLRVDIAGWRALVRSARPHGC